MCRFSYLALTLAVAFACGTAQAQAPTTSNPSATSPWRTKQPTTPSSAVPPVSGMMTPLRPTQTPQPASPSPTQNITILGTPAKQAPSLWGSKSGNSQGGTTILGTAAPEIPNMPGTNPFKAPDTPSSPSTTEPTDNRVRTFQPASNPTGNASSLTPAVSAPAPQTSNNSSGTTPASSSSSPPRGT